MRKYLSEDTKNQIKDEIDTLAYKMLIEDDPEELKKLKDKQEILESLLKPNFQVSSDTIVLAAVNLAGILLILNHERLNIISSKAMSFVSRIRV